MENADLQKLAKIMERTRSDMEGEATTALKMANAMLSRLDLTWHQVLGLAPSTEAIKAQQAAQNVDLENFNPPENFADATEQTVDLLFAVLMNEVGAGKISGFVESVFDRWDAVGTITEKQYKGLVNTLNAQKKMKQRRAGGRPYDPFDKRETEPHESTITYEDLVAIARKQESRLQSGTYSLKAWEQFLHGKAP